MKTLDLARRRAAALLLIAALAMFGCGDDDDNPTGGGDRVDFETQIQPIFTNSCAFSGCHAGSSPGGGMLLSINNAYSNLVDVDSDLRPGWTRVVPGDAEASLLIQKLTIPGLSTPELGSRMPQPPALPLDNADIELIRRWINEGADETLN
jgi:hypothetical protein